MVMMVLLLASFLQNISPQVLEGFFKAERIVWNRFLDLFPPGHEKMVAEQLGYSAEVLELPCEKFVLLWFLANIC